MSECFGVASGWYSDYTVHCVFAAEEDAKEYALLVNRRSANEYHNRYRTREGSTSPWVLREVEKHQAATFEECEECTRRLDDEDDYDNLRVQRFQFYPEGAIPHMDAEQ